MSSGQKKSYYLSQILNLPLSDSIWPEISEKIATSQPNQRPIIRCENVNPSDLKEEHLSYLFYEPVNNNWQPDDYDAVFKGLNDNFGEFIFNLSEGNIQVAPKPETTTTAPNSTRLHPGDIIDNRYKIIKPLGQGNFGRTYLASDEKFPDSPTCVVKQFQPVASDAGTISSARSLFQREAETLAKLDHPHIPRLFAYFEENNQFYLVQQFMEGTPLDQLIKPNQPWEESRLINLLKNILEPLKYLHQHNIIHRDLKPSNLIQLSVDEAIALIDFGAVKAIIQGSGSNTIVGTPGYMPPEQAMGNACLNSDIYAVGMIAIQAATGCDPQALPWDKNTQKFLWQNKASQLKQSLKDVIERMISYQSSQRYLSAQETLEVIKEIEKQPPREGSKTNNPSENGNGISKPILIGAGLGAIALAVIGLKSIPFFTKPKISTNTVTIGTLWKPESYVKLTDHLKKELVPSNYFDYLQGKEITVIINGDKSLAYEEAQNRIKDKQWDVAFANSPVLSMFAKEQGYSYLGAMFPDSPGYQSGLFVASDSPINSIDDIKPSTIVALGSFNSASSFYMPSYALYGKTISVDMDNRGAKIIEKVKKGEADVGAAAIGDAIKKDDPSLKIIYVSSKIPGAGVYLSPKLSPQDQEAIKKVMLTAPSEVLKDANYGPNIPEPDYNEFKKVMNRVDEILVCSDFKKNPVNLYCPGNGIMTISGNINGASIKGDTYLLKVVDKENKIYSVNVGKDLFGEIFGTSDLTKVQNKAVNIKIPAQFAGDNITITQSQQLKKVQ